MSFNRRRNIFTLGDYQIQQHPHQYAKARKHNSDPFERDPFKIQSYNFHYADRPSYPLQNLVNRVSSQTSVKRFETHFYNYDFAAAGCNKENSTASSTTASTNGNRFHEFRRRKFLHAQQQQQQQQAAPTTHHMSSAYGGGGQTLNSRQRLGGNNTGSNSSLRQQFQQQQQQQQQQWQYQQEQYQQQQQQLRQPSPHRHQQQHHAFCVPCSSSSVNANNMSAIYAYAAPTTTTANTPLLRTGCNREFLQGIRAVSSSNASDAPQNLQEQCLQQQKHHHQQQQQQYQHQKSRELQRSKSRSCLPVSQRFLSELGCRSSGTGIGGSGSNSTTALNNATDKNIPRFSLSQHNNINNASCSDKRKPLHTLSPKNLVTASVEQKQSSTGCHINININGLNAEQMAGENLTIKIESDNRSVRGLSTSSNNLSEHITSPNKTDNFNIVPSTTNSQTFGIDKRLSKFAISSLREISSDRSQAVDERKKTPSEAEKKAIAEFYTPIRSSPPIKTETIAADVLTSSSNMRRKSKERLPSLVPWNIDENLRSCFSKENDPDIDVPQNRPTNQMRRIRTAYNSAFRDMRNLQKYADELNEAKRKRTEKKLLNTCCATPPLQPQHRQQHSQQQQQQRLQPRILPNLTPPRQNTSRHSMRSNELNNTMNLMKCGSSELDRRQQSRQSLNKSPFNVNINVYADKCKLLRV